MTAEEFLDEYIEENHLGFIPKREEDIANIMIEFAKYHVKQALNDIYENAKHGDEEHQLWLKEFFDNYPLNNIK